MRYEVTVLKTVDVIVSGFNRKAVNTLKSVVDRHPGELGIWNDLGVKCLLAGQQEEARNAFNEVRINLSFFFDFTHTDGICAFVCLFVGWLVD